MQVKLSRVGSWSFLPAIVLTLSAGVAFAQDPANFDLEIRVDKEAYAPGETLVATPGVVAREAGIQGWSYGVRHDPNVLSLDSVGIENSDTAGLFDEGFNQTEIIVEGGTNVGFIQAIALSLDGDAIVVPANPDGLFTFAAASYTVAADACEGAVGDIMTAIEFTEEIGVPDSPPVETNLTLGGRGLVPASVAGATATITCEALPAGLSMHFAAGAQDLVADETATIDVTVHGSASGAASEVQGWSYGIRLDTTAIVATAATPGADAAALNGGNGPDFVSYELNDQSLDGNTKGVTVGVAVTLNAPAAEVLTIADGETKHLDTITIRSAKSLGEGESETTEMAFDNTLGETADPVRDPIEAIFVIGGRSVEPTLGGAKTINLIGTGGPGGVRFIRSDSNSDGRVDIADGIWTLMTLFGGEQLSCEIAADSNADDSVNMTDAMHTFQWRLQPGATPGNLFPAPTAPFPACGTVQDPVLTCANHFCQ